MAKENTHNEPKDIFAPLYKDDMWMLAQIHPKVQLWFISLILKEICKIWGLPKSDFDSLYKHFKSKYKL